MLGYSCACAIAKEYSLSEHKHILIVCGPGNNGFPLQCALIFSGDGLVAARHLSHFGYCPTVYYPKKSSGTLFSNLLKQNESMDIPLADHCPTLYFLSCILIIREELKENYDLVVDAIFGFSFHGSPRPPFDSIISIINECGKPVVSVDIPSGWDVNEGDIHECAVHHPDMLISLTAPKLGSQKFSGRFHYLGGRFLPPKYAREHNIQIPSYPGCEQCVRLSFVC